MPEIVLTAVSSVITGIVTLVGILYTSRKNTDLIVYRLDQLEEQVRDLTSQKLRIQKLEERCAVIEERQKVVNHRIDNLEKKDRAN